MAEQPRQTLDELPDDADPADAVTTGDPLGTEPERPRAGSRRVTYSLPEAGDTLDGRYEILAVLGEGGFGIVYKARQANTGQLVAVKVLLPDHLGHAHGHVSDAFAVARERFRREMRIVGELRHRHIVRLIDSGELDGGLLYMVLEFIEGLELSKVLRREAEAGRAMAPPEARRLMLQVLSALAHAHARGYIHRDLKPQNIMITAGGLETDAVVLDFGIAGVSESDTDDPMKLTRTRQAIGTVSYMAPEQLNGRKALATDIYAWGLIFLECLTGRTVVTGDTPFAAVAVHMSSEPLLLPASIARHPLGRILARAIAKSLDERYASVEELYRDLQACAVDDLTVPWSADGSGEALIATGRLGNTRPTTDRGSEDERSGPRPVPDEDDDEGDKAAAPARRPVALMVAAAVALVALVIGLAVWLGDNDPQPSATAQPSPTTAPPPTQAPPVDPVPEPRRVDLDRIERLARQQLAAATVSAIALARETRPAGPEAEAEFARLRDEALKKMRRRQFAEAATLFEQAFALHDDPQSLGSWALALEKSGQPCAALEKYQRTIDLGVGATDLARARVTVLARDCAEP